VRESWNVIVVCGVMRPNDGAFRYDEAPFREVQEAISWWICSHVLERFAIGLLQVLRFERETVIVCGKRTSDEKISWRSSRGSVRRGEDMVEMLQKSKCRG